jgi:LysM repeat protein
MMKKAWIFISLAAAGMLLLSLSWPAPVGVMAQSAYQTPTPGPDGRILYVVKSGENCLSISLLTGVSLDQLRKLNNLNANCTIQAGQKLLLALAGPAEASPTPGPSPTPTPILPTPTPQKGTGEVCIALFNDVNGNSLREDTEGLVEGGVVSLTDRTGKTSLTGTTAGGTDALCFKDVPEGDYNVSLAVPAGYNSTTVMNYALPVRAGDQAMLDLGAQVSSKAATPTPSEGGRSPILGILGAILLLGGAGLGVYVWRMRK